MRPVSKVLTRLASMVAAVWAGGVLAAAPCDKPVYLTLDTGHMGVAPLIADVLKRQQVKATFFLANEPSKTPGGSSLDDEWAPWWKARAAEGHLFASHTYDHVYWRADLPGGQFQMRPSAGPQSGKTLTWSPAQYCQELQRSATRFTAMTGQAMAPLFRAPGGKTSPALIAAARSCGYAHVPWAAAGFLGDELSSDAYPNKVLLARALQAIRPGDILMAHLGIWSRQDPWAPAVLEPLIEGLKARGMCFATLRDHPDYRQHLAAAQISPPIQK
jgi:peptidoglycan-N-acetylmuramic acid deacetylase